MNIDTVSKFSADDLLELAKLLNVTYSLAENAKTEESRQYYRERYRRIVDRLSCLGLIVHTRATLRDTIDHYVHYKEG